MSLTVSFLHRDPQWKLFPLVANILRSEYKIKTIFIQDVATLKGQEIFAYEPEIEKIWDSLDISYEALQKLRERYPDFDFLRALYSERQFNYYPSYYGFKPVPYEYQMRYLVGCFNVFERFFANHNIYCVISELISSLDDAILNAVAEKKAVKFFSVRQSKMSPGIVICNPYHDIPLGMLKKYSSFLEGKIPDNIRKKTEKHIRELRDIINPPSYMEVTKKDYRLITRERIVRRIKKLIPVKSHYTSISLRKDFRRRSLRFPNAINVSLTRWSFDEWFKTSISPDERYFLYPLHYEPEASTLVRAFYYSDQIALIKQIAKLLPLGVKLVVKEHRGHEGYRSYKHYKEISYLPNVILVPRNYDGTSLLKNCLGVLTLTGRMGWEAIINNIPVVAFGKTFWTSFDGVYTVQSWQKLKDVLGLINCSMSEGFRYDQEKLIAFAAAYIDCVHEGSYVVKSKDFPVEDNAQKFIKMMLAEMLEKKENVDTITFK